MAEQIPKRNFLDFPFPMIFQAPIVTRSRNKQQGMTPTNINKKQKMSNAGIARCPFRHRHRLPDSRIAILEFVFGKAHHRELKSEEVHRKIMGEKENLLVLFHYCKFKETIGLKTPGNYSASIWSCNFSFAYGRTQRRSFL